MSLVISAEKDFRGRRLASSAKLSRPRSFPDQDSWREHLSNRMAQKPLSELFEQAKSSPIVWCQPICVDEKTSELAQRLFQIIRQQATSPSCQRAIISSLDEWLSADSGPSISYALECLSLAYALPILASFCEEQQWWDLLQNLVAVVEDAAGIDLEESPLLRQLLAGELPLVLASLFPELPRCRSLAAGAKKELSLGLVELLDGEGLPRARDLTQLRPLLALWTRSAVVAGYANIKCFSKDARVQYEWLIRQAMRLSRYDGSQVFSSPADEAPYGEMFCKELFRTAVGLSEDEDDAPIAAASLPSGRSFGKMASDDELPDPGVQSEWSSLAILRRGWSRSTDHLTIRYDQADMLTELNCGRETIWSGRWRTRLRINGEDVIDPAGEWEQSCWVSDEDVDYIELEMPLGSGRRIERHILLAREDRFLLLADSILGGETAQMDYQTCLPLCEEFGFRAEEETHDGHLMRAVDQDRRGVVLPLALPEWRASGREGELKMTDKGLVLHQVAKQARLFAPLFIDLEPRRIGKAVTWRNLTVAQRLEITTASEAVGHRVQSGNRQWLIYRSLAEQANRTVLGQNLSCQLLVAQFDRAGDVDPLIEIE